MTATELFLVFRSNDEVGAWVNYVVNVAARNEPGVIGAVMMDADNFIKGIRQRTSALMPPQQRPGGPSQ